MPQQIRTGRPRPEAVVQYVVWTGDFADIPAKWRATGHFRMDESGELVINTNHSPIRAELGWHIMRGVANEFYAVPPAIYYGKYEDVDA